ncbi:MAG: hypothetical protein HY606_09240 [Planctomycetes bacterium]|nr:hypothetical protein [Planctomycetota bacterium]
MEKHIALVTCKDYPDLAKDDLLLMEPLKKMGFQIDIKLWDSKTDWDRYDSVIIRSTWDYHQRVSEFSGWLDHLESKKARVWNPVSLIKWNINKKYLYDLEKNDIPIIPSIFVEKNSSIDLKTILVENSWETAVIKPVISAGARNTFKVSINEISNIKDQISNLLTLQDLMIQPFISDIQVNGELSFIFFGDQYSHCVIKKPASGDYRVQEKLGGTTSIYRPDLNSIASAKRVVDQIKQKTLYARVDMIPSNSELLLVELEIIEPALFLQHYAPAAQRFAESLRSLV